MLNIKPSEGDRFEMKTKDANSVVGVVEREELHAKPNTKYRVIKPILRNGKTYTSGIYNASFEEIDSLFKYGCLEEVKQSDLPVEEKSNG